MSNNVFVDSYDAKCPDHIQQWTAVAMFLHSDARTVLAALLVSCILQQLRLLQIKAELGVKLKTTTTTTTKNQTHTHTRTQRKKMRSKHRRLTAF